MIAYLNGIVKMVDENSFKNKDTNEMVEYRTIYIQVEDEDGNLKAEQINTKMDVRPFIEKYCMFKILIRPDIADKKLKRVSLIDIEELPENK